MSVAVKENVPLAPYTIYKIGGPARFFVEVKNSSELEEAVRWAADKKAQIFILGAGSNILVSDKGFNGLVIKMNLRGVTLTESGKLVAESGVSMARAVLESAKAGLTGFEWGIGIPGTIGGSVRGNAGCFGGEMAQVVESARVFRCQVSGVGCQVYELTNSECQFGYRDSIFKKHPDWIILSATLKLKKGDPKEIKERIAAITKERSEKQDIGTKSCGCIFKNASRTRKDINWERLFAEFPELEQFKNQPNIPASFLIDRAGLKGRRVGRVFISPKHANFFVNEGGASAEEVKELVEIAKDVVRQKYGIVLEEEIQYVGF